MTRQATLLSYLNVTLIKYIAFPNIVHSLPLDDSNTTCLVKFNIIVLANCLTSHALNIAKFSLLYNQDCFVNHRIECWLVLFVQRFAGITNLLSNGDEPLFG